MRLMPVLAAALLLALSGSSWAEKSRSTRSRVDSGPSRAAVPAQVAKPSPAARAVERTRSPITRDASPTERVVTPPAAGGMVEMRDPIRPRFSGGERVPVREGVPVLAPEPVTGRDAARAGAAAAAVGAGAAAVGAGAAAVGAGGGGAPGGAGTRATDAASGPDGETPAKPGRAPVDRADQARRNAAIEVDRLSRVRAEAQALPQSAYRRPDDIAKHRALLTRVDDAARMVEQRAATLPARDLALSRYYLSQASGAAQSVNAQAQQAQPIGDDQLGRLERAARPVQAMRERLARGQAPFERRRVTVTVRDAEGRNLGDPLRVYVLPAGLVDSPPDQPELIRELLSELSFERLTSPSTGTVLEGDMRVWVGPDFQYEEMAQLVMQGRLKRFAPVRGHQTGAPDPNLVFVAPDSITVPRR